jgi:hypothetical protein
MHMARVRVHWLVVLSRLTLALLGQMPVRHFQYGRAILSLQSLFSTEPVVSTVLLVEDNLQLAEAIVSDLQDHGFQIIHVSGGKAAWRC